MRYFGMSDSQPIEVAAETADKDPIESVQQNFLLRNAALRLQMVQGIGPRIYGELIERFGSAEEVLAASPSDIRGVPGVCLLYTSPSPRDGLLSRMPSSA